MTHSTLSRIQTDLFHRLSALKFTHFNLHDMRDTLLGVENIRVHTSNTHPLIKQLFKEDTFYSQLLTRSDLTLKWISLLNNWFSTVLLNAQTQNLLHSDRNQICTRESYHSTPIISEDNTSNNDEECSICLERIARGEGSCLTCQHPFHVQCILNWIEKRQRNYDKCPVCRQVLSDQILGRTSIPNLATRTTRSNADLVASPTPTPNIGMDVTGIALNVTGAVGRIAGRACYKVIVGSAKVAFICTATPFIATAYVAIAVPYVCIQTIFS
jgi:hypothetical protein